MNKIATSQAKFFLLADYIYETIGLTYRRVVESVSLQPKAWFRVAAIVSTYLCLVVLCIGIIDLAKSEFAEHEFQARHAALIDAIKTANRDPAYHMPYTIEQIGIAYKMFNCRSQYGKGELYCSTNLIAEAAVNGGDQRAKAVKATLQELKFKVPDWF